MTERQRILHEAAIVRDKAEALLRGLQVAKSTAERQLGEAPRPDAMKSLTGKSSIENAIASTKRMIESLDRTLSQLKANLSDEDLALLNETR